MNFDFKGFTALTRKRVSKTSTSRQEAESTSDQAAAAAASSSKKPLPSEESLNSSLAELVEASERYAKEDCYKRSSECERKARLVALQIALLQSGTNVLDLAESELNNVIVNFESFRDAYIVAEAYDYHSTWRQALFVNVILRGHALYLDEYCNKYELSSPLVEELVLLYKQYINSNQVGSQEESMNLAQAMKSLLLRLADVELRCKIYAQLDFYDARERLLRDSAVEAHLKDLKLA